VRNLTSTSKVFDYGLIGMGPAGIGFLMGLRDTEKIKDVICFDKGSENTDVLNCSSLLATNCSCPVCSIVTGVGGASKISSGKISDYPAGSGLETFFDSKQQLQNLLKKEIMFLQDKIQLKKMSIDYKLIQEKAEGYKAAMTKFLRDVVKFPGESCGEKEHAERILEEMKMLEFDEAYIDKQGNVMGFMGKGDKIIAFDGHIDTVGIGNRANWTFDPYEGFEDDLHIGGRGVSDQLGGVISAVYGARIMKELNLIPEGYKVMVVGTVQEEDCDGLCWEYIIKKSGIRPEFVVSTEPTDGGIYRGQRGRMEIRVDVQGVSCHGSAPERGDNAIYKMSEIIQNVRDLNANSADESTAIRGLVKMLDKKYNPEHYEEANFLGRGTVTVSQIFYTSPSRCAVADSCSISLDRRMTAGETWQSCLKEIEDLPAVQKYGAKVSMYEYDVPSWTGEVYPIECYFPTWVIPKDHNVTKSLEKVYQGLYNTELRKGDVDNIEMRQARPLTDKWTFSTNGVSIMGRNGIPCIGFGPGAEAQAHAPNEITWKNDLVTCAALYAGVPYEYSQIAK